jgi:hypothetical protein
MVKLLKKYKIYLLVGFGVLIVFVFVGQQFLTNLQHRQWDAEVFRLGGRSISQRELQLTRLREDAFKQTLRMFAAEQNFDPSIFVNAFFERVLGIRNSDHWLLLAEEARRHGLIGNTVQPREFGELVADLFFAGSFGPDWRTPPLNLLINPTDDMARIEQQMKMMQYNQSAELLARIARESAPMITGDRGPTVQVGQALEEAAGIMRLIRLYQGAARGSTPRIAAELRQKYDRAFVDRYFLAVDRNATAAEPDPSEEQITAHFEKYRDRFPFDSLEAQRERAAGVLRTADPPFGYRLPNAAKIDVISAPIDQIANSVTISRAWVLARADALRASAGAVSDAELTRQATEQIRRELADAAQRGIERVISAEQDTADRTGRPIDLEAAARAAANGAAAALKSKIEELSGGTQTAAPPLLSPLDVTRGTRWVTLQNATAQPGIGLARLEDPTLTGRGVGIPLTSILASLDVFKPERKFVDIRPGVVLLRPLTERRFEAGVPSRVLHWILVREVREERTPLLEDEDIRSQVINDLKALSAFERLKADATILVTMARFGSFEALAGELAARGYNAPLVQREEVSRRPQQVLPDFAAGTDYVNQVMSQVERLTHTLPIMEQPIDQRIMEIVLPPRLGVAIINIVEFWPHYQELVRAQPQNYVTLFAERPRIPSAPGQLPQIGAVGALSFENLAAKLGFRITEEQDSPGAHSPNARQAGSAPPAS